MEICNKGSRHSEYQRSGIKLRNLAFCVWENGSFWAHWIPLHLSSLGQILCPCSPCFLYSPSSSAITVMRCQHLQDRSLGSPHSYLKARNCWWLWHFLFLNMAWGIFISQEFLLCLVLFVCFLRNSYAALHISCTHFHPGKEGRRIPYSLSPLWDLVSVDHFDIGLSEQYEGWFLVVGLMGLALGSSHVKYVPKCFGL